MKLTGEHYRFLLEHLAGAVVEVDGALSITWASDSLETMLGRPKADVLGRSVAELILPEDREVVGRVHRAARPGGTVVVRARLNRPDQELWVELVSEPVDTPEGQRGVASIRDITEEVRATVERDDAQQRLAALVEHSSDVVVRLDVDGHLVWASPSFEQEFGTPPDSAIGTLVTDLVAPQDRYRVDALLKGAGGDFSDRPAEFRVQPPGEEPRWLQARISEPIDQGRDRFERLLLLRNVTQEVVTRDQVEASERRFRRVMHNSATGMAILAADGSVLEMNESLSQMLDLPQGMSVQLTSTLLDASAESEDFAQGLRDVARGEREHVQGFVNLRGTDNRPRRMHVSLAIVEHSDPAHRTFVAQVIDMTAEREAQQAAEYEATHDALTGLTNRRVLMDRLQQGLDSREGCALLYCDVDNMKLINDGLGHHIGDLALQNLAARMKDVARHDDLVTRVGGDEFVLMFTGPADAAGWAAVADRIIEEAARPMDIEGEEFSFSVSAGLAMSEPEDTIVSLMQRADAALYEAKRKGRNRWVAFTDHLRRTTQHTLKLREDLKRGLAAGEFSVQYQPIVALSRDAVIAHEALVRWNHPVDGMRLPATFLEVAEQSGIIREIDQRVFDIVLEDLAAGLIDTPVSVNLSAVHISDAEAMDRIHDSLEAHPLLRHRIWLEVTETALPGLVDEAIAQLARLDAAGARLVLDDFGTGFASLYYLAKAPISVIKIDQSLTHVDSANGKASGLLTWIRTLGSNLGIMVIAEGIETDEQLVWLRDQGIDYGQGWALGHPAAVS